MGPIALVRAPFTYRYNSIDVREEVILTQLSQYLSELSIDHDIYDFHLARSTHASDIVATDPSTIIIAVRETGDNVHYALRLARFLRSATIARVILYGQTSRLTNHPLLPEGVVVVIHSELELAKAIGLSRVGPHFETGLSLQPYFERMALAPWQQARFRGTIETSRGCPFPCNFCFINSGKNHDQRWILQNIDRTLDGLNAYVDRGTHAFVFHDSEFLGGGRHNTLAREHLVERMIAERPDVLFKIYARADTISKYPRLDKLREAGLVSVFIGVESFVQEDLDALNKKLKTSTLHNAISILAENEIYMDLSFILFNHNTTVSTLRTNIETIKILYASPNARLLGMPHFSFSFESPWRNAPTRPLTGRTYVDWDVRIKTPIVDGVVFDTTLEPLMEVYRLLAYEWSKKVVELNLARDQATPSEKRKIEGWFKGLGLFCAEIMSTYLDRFVAGKLTLENLDAGRHELIELVNAYYKSLPKKFRAIATFSSHLSAIDYTNEVSLVELDEYWVDQIPDPISSSNERISA